MENVDLFIPNTRIDTTITIKAVKAFDINSYDTYLNNLVNNKLNGIADELFNPNDPFKSMWTDHPESFYRVGGLILALAYKMDSIYVGKAR